MSRTQNNANRFKSGRNMLTVLDKMFVEKR